MEISNCLTSGAIYKLFEDVKVYDLCYIYRGQITTPVTDNILSVAETDLLKAENSPGIRNKIYFIMVESLQNITKHQVSADKNVQDFSNLFLIQKNEENYRITTANTVENTKIDKLKSILEEINSLNQAELGKYAESLFSSGKGIGFGLIEMARKSGNKLVYDFEKLDKKLSCFYLQTGVKSVTELSGTEVEMKKAMVNIIDIHKMLAKENILWVFYGLFNQESFINMLGALKAHVSESQVQKNKILFNTIEMLQNIVKHGYKPDSSWEGNPGMFCVGYNNKEYILTSVNYIENTRREALENTLKHVNGMSKEALHEHYEKNVFDFDGPAGVSGGIGITDLRMKSENLIVYNFQKINDTYSFFSLQTKIKS